MTTTARPGACVTDTSVSARNGTYVGRRWNGVSEFLGIRYAKPATRWRRAVAPETTSEDILFANSWGASCVQPFEQGELASISPQSEDCLTLNLWTRNHAAVNKPVMVFIHGGGGVSGGSIDPLYHGRNLVEAVSDEEDIVVVTINYRLGVFGTLNLEGLPGFRNEYHEGLNLWLRDQQLALLWVQRNIGAFGGDPQNVTVFGQSAGAGFISTHLSIPESRELFRRAIVQSGPLVNRQITLEKSREIAAQIIDALGVRNLNELLALPAKAIRDRAMAGDGPAFGGAVFFPVLDSDFVPKDGFRALALGEARQIDLLIGNTSGERDTIAAAESKEYPAQLREPSALIAAISRYESTVAGASSALTVLDHPDILHRYLSLFGDESFGLAELCNDLNYRMGAVLMAQAQSEWNSNTYNYIWNWAPEPGSVLDAAPESGEVSPFGRALHCTELPFVLRNPAGIESVTGAADTLPKSLISQASSAWISFARDGKPTPPGTPDWRPYTRSDRATMLIDDDWSLEIDPDRDRREVLSELPLSARLSSLTHNAGATAHAAHHERSN